MRDCINSLFRFKHDQQGAGLHAIVDASQAGEST